MGRLPLDTSATACFGVTVHVATGVIGRELLRDIINCHLNLDPDNEEIKLRLYECLSNAIAEEAP